MPGRTVNDARGRATVVVGASVTAGGSVVELLAGLVAGLLDALVARLVDGLVDGLLAHEAAARPSSTDATKTIRGERTG